MPSVADHSISAALFTVLRYRHHRKSCHSKEPKLVTFFWPDSLRQRSAHRGPKDHRTRRVQASIVLCVQQVPILHCAPDVEDFCIPLQLRTWLTLTDGVFVDAYKSEKKVESRRIVLGIWRRKSEGDSRI